jgi:glycosyltransferase involved in cell wall biosynthesis
VTWASSPCETTLPLTTDLLFLGRLDPIKRIPDLIAALRLLTPCPYPLPPFSLHICGEGPDVPRLQQLRQANPDLDIHLHAFSLTPHQALAQADILILPSQAEGFGLVLIEAMAAGVPVIASDAPGIRDVVSHDTTGLLYPTGDTQALANAIQRLTQDPQLRARLTTAARAKVESTYAWNRVLPMYEDALRLTPP